MNDKIKFSMDVDVNELREVHHPANGARNPRAHVPRRNQNVRRDRGRQRRLRYNHIWELDRTRRRWLRRVPDNESRAQCILCNKTMTATLHVIKSHARTQRHLTLVEALDENEDENLEEDLEEQFKTKVAKIKIKLSVFFARNKLPFKLIDDLIPVMIDLAGDFEALRAVKMKRDTLRNITVNGVAAVHKQKLKEDLVANKFSILFDESTDVSNSKHGCIVVRYFNEHQNKIMSALWDIVPIYDIDDEESAATAEVIYNRIVQSFKNFQEIPRDNVLSFCSDGCNTMVGEHNSVSQRFKRDFHGTFNVSCSCHAVHLVGAGAFKILPESIQQFPRDVYNCFNSSKRLFMLRQNQIREMADINKILRPVPTRWLVMGPVVNRIIEQWVPLNLTVNEIVNPPELVIKVRDMFADPTTKYYMLFLKYILPIFENFNGAMQRESVMLPYVYERTKTMLHQVMSIFIKDEYLEDEYFLNINLHDEDYQKHVLEMDLGENLIAIQEEAAGEEDLYAYVNFAQICKNYLITAAEEIRKRLEIEWRRSKCLNCLIPLNAISNDFHNHNVNVIDELHAIFIRAALGYQDYDMELDNLKRQWNILPQHTEQLQTFYDVADNGDYITNIDGFWYKVMQFRNELDEYIFKDFGRFALNILCIPHGNAEPERKWSEERITKTYLRNRLELPSLNALMLISDMLKLKGCYEDTTKFEPCPLMIEVVKNHLYNENNNLQELLELINEDGDEDNDEMEQENEEMEEENEINDAE